MRPKSWFSTVNQNTVPHISLIECTHDLSEYSNNTVATNKLWHHKTGKYMDTLIQFSVSDTAVNLVVHHVSWL